MLSLLVSGEDDVEVDGGQDGGQVGLQQDQHVELAVRSLLVVELEDPGQQQAGEEQQGEDDQVELIFHGMAAASLLCFRTVKCSGLAHRSHLKKLRYSL